MYDIKIHPHKLHFKQPAGTSRGTYVTRDVWYLHLTSDMYPDRIGIGECAPLPKLSCDDIPDYESVLSRICNRVAAEGTFSVEELREYPSILFGLETAFRHLQGVLHFGIRLFHMEKLEFLLMVLSGWAITKKCLNRLK